VHVVRISGVVMTVLMWLGIALGVLVAVAMGLRVVGNVRWVELVRAQTSLLESGNVGAKGRFPSPTRFDAHELEGLPAPVQRYFRTVLTDGQPIIAAATIKMTGTPSTCRQRPSNGSRSPRGSGLSPASHVSFGMPR